MFLVPGNLRGVDFPIDTEDQVDGLLHHTVFVLVPAEFVRCVPAFKVVENLCVCVCVRERGREIETDRQRRTTSRVGMDGSCISKSATAAIESNE